jgi:hypothetical protein
MWGRASALPRSTIDDRRIVRCLESEGKMIRDAFTLFILAERRPRRDYLNLTCSDAATSDARLAAAQP